MKKIFLLMLALLLCAPVHAGVFDVQKARIEQNKIYKSNLNEIKTLIESQTLYANQHNSKALSSLYSKDFVNSDGFDKELYLKLIEDTFKTYPDITYKTEIKNINIFGNYAEVLVTETAFAVSKEDIGEFELFGELYSTSKCVYHLEKHGTVWLINAESIIEETSALKFGDASKINMELNTPKITGANKDYTVTLNVDAPENSVIIASINKENIVYPQTKSEEIYRRLPESNMLQRVFHSNSNNLNEYAIASVGITHAKSYKTGDIRIYMDGFAFIMTRVNVIPENKFIDKDKIKDEQSK